MAETMKEKASDLAANALAITPAAEAVAVKAGHAVARVDEMSSHLNRSIRKSLAEQPMMTLAAAAALGLVLGALWRR